VFPWGHAAVGYLVYSLAGRYGSGTGPTASGTVVLGFATQLPDLVDKPLAWHAALLPNGRSLAHSLFAAALLVALVRWVAATRGRGSLGTAFGIGYVTHLAGDALYPAVTGRLADLGFLLWPLVPPAESDHTGGILTYFTTLEFGPVFWFELVLAGAALAVWYRDGLPGTGPRVRRVLRVPDP
jgi:membrane-bound metal-dependent hydrolase YbcI (DUF457 family)